MNTFNWKTYPFIDYLDVEKHEVNKLPKGVTISTITCSCKPGLGTNVNLDNIYNYLPLNSDDILKIKVDNTKIKTLIPAKPKKRRTKKSLVSKKKNTATRHFYHQITIVVRVDDGNYKDLNDVEKINIKVFRNGSLQMSGVNQIEYANRAINKLIYRLKQSKGKMVEGKIEKINFVEEPSKLGIGTFKVDMINTNYEVNMQIDRDKLYNLLLKMKVRASFEPCVRACVIIKYTPKKNNPQEKDISIFVFQKGNIIITGAKSRDHVISSYNYINDILVDHSYEINKNEEKVKDDEIMKLYKEIKEEYAHKMEELLMVDY